MTAPAGETVVPWGARLAAIGLAGRTCQVDLRTENGRHFALAFVDGIVVGATSPLAADAVARIAMRERLVTAAQVSALARKRKSVIRDEVGGFVTAFALPPADVQRLKRRVLLERAARSFAVEHAEVTVADRISIPLLFGVEVDVRAIIYEGARRFLDADRLAADLRGFGSRFVLSTTTDELVRFELSNTEQPIVDALRAGTSLPELEARHRELDPRMMQAVIYAFASCGVVAAEAVTGAPSLPRVPTPRAPTTSRVPTPRDPTLTRVPTPREPTLSRVPKLVRDDPSAPVAREEAITNELPLAQRAMTEPFLEVRETTIRPNALTPHQVRELIDDCSARLERNVDHFTLLAVPIGASIEAVRTAYIEIARYLQPDRLAELGIHDSGHRARTVFAQICIAYTVLTEPARRAEYMTALRRTGANADFARLAAEAFVRGERALRHEEIDIAVAELRTACELVPGDLRYVATLGRAEYAAIKRRWR